MCETESWWQQAASHSHSSSCWRSQPDEAKRAEIQIVYSVQTMEGLLLMSVYFLLQWRRYLFFMGLPSLLHSSPLFCFPPLRTLLSSSSLLLFSPASPVLLSPLLYSQPSSPLFCSSLHHFSTHLSSSLFFTTPPLCFPPLLRSPLLPSLLLSTRPLHHALTLAYTEDIFMFFLSALHVQLSHHEQKQETGSDRFNLF